MAIAPRQSRTLGSWKEIASYLGKGVRTVQRWEQHYGLPVRRPNSASKGVVFANSEELDFWLKRRWSRKLTAPMHGKQAELDMNQEVRNLQDLRRINKDIVKELLKNVGALQKQCEELSRTLIRSMQVRRGGRIK